MGAHSSPEWPGDEAGELFPRPRRLADVIAVTANASLDPCQLYSLLGERAAQASAGDTTVISNTTCLLYRRGWVFKARRGLAREELDEVRPRVVASAALTGRVAVWHPAKCWFIVRAGNGYWPCNACPYLRPLHAAGGSHRSVATRKVGMLWRASRQGYTSMRMWQLVARALWPHHFMLDPNPTNFGRAGDGALYYLDDEVYAFSGWKALLTWSVQVVS